jgi:hypothetical protein
MIRRYLLAGLVILSQVLHLTIGVAGALAATPDFQLPFPCGDVWRGSTYGGHGWATDWDDPATAENDNRLVLNSAAGDVINASRWDLNGELVIDHGDGWITVYAHLDNSLPPPSGFLPGGALLGRIDPTPNDDYVEPNGYAHLHYEQKHNGVGQQVRFDGSLYSYQYNVGNTGPHVESNNNCGGVPSSAFFDDILMVRQDGTGMKVFRLRGNGLAAHDFSVNSADGPNFNPDASDSNFVVGDFDNDGAMDDFAIAAPGASGGVEIKVWYNGGNSNQDYSAVWATLGSSLGAFEGRMAIGSVDGS